MRTRFSNQIVLVVCGLGLTAGAGCSSSSSSSDASTSLDGGPDVTADSNPSDGAVLFGLTPGSWCYKVTAASNVTDGCGLQVGDTVAAGGLVGADLPVQYTLTSTMGTLGVGTDGSLGQGVISNNVGTLLRDGTTMLTSMAACTFHQTDTSDVTLTDTNAFTISVTEVQDTFASACSTSNVPTGGTCSSTWTWTMAIDGSVDSGTNGCP